jgi:hypothetical protein
MKNQQLDDNKRKRIMVMIALIVIPFLLAALLWWLLPSGYNAQMASEDSVSCQTYGWHPLQPAIKLGNVILKP